MTRVLVAGASGVLGRHVVKELSSRDYRVRAMIRDPDKAALIECVEETSVLDLLDPRANLQAAVKEVDVVFSAAGQPCTLKRVADRRSFRAVDPRINRTLLKAAIASGVQKFVYITVLAVPELRELDYVAAHDEFIADLRASSIDHTIVHANGFFYSYLDLLDFARRGLAITFVDGKARSNPIHEADLAFACVEAMEGGSEEIEVGGPQPITRREEIELTFAAVQRKVRVLRLPHPLFRAALPLLRLRDRRRAEMLEFLAALSATDLLAPQHGNRRLGEYLHEHA